jgi:T-complex protein 1 subunit theta
MAKSMSLNAAAGLGGMLKDGHKSFSGVHGAVLKNIEAAKGIAEMVQSSLGPNGMNKLVINHLEKTFVTSDCATILSELEVQHPAAKMLVLASQTQETEHGDNTNFVMSFAGELLKNAEELIKQGVHTAEIVNGYQMALKKALEILPTLVVKSVDDMRNEEQVVAAIKSVVGTKQYGQEEFLSKLIANACITTFSATSNKPRLNADSVRIAKLRGGNTLGSTTVKGMVILRDAESHVKRAEKCKVAVFGCGIEASSAEAKSTVLLKNADELLNYNKSEEAALDKLIGSIAATGAKVVIANGTVSEMALHFLNKYNLMVIKIMSKFEIRRICGAVGATAVVKLAPPTPEEMGFVALLEVREIAQRKVCILSQDLDEDTSVATIVLRASTENVMNDLERSVDDGVCSIKTLCNDPRLLPGAGAVELELCKQLKTYADEVKGLDQYAIRKFGEAFDVVPRTLTENSGCDATVHLHNLHQAHADESNPNSKNMGFEIDEHTPADSVERGIFDLYATKINALRLAVDAAITVLRVDQIVMSKQAGGPKAPSM